MSLHILTVIDYVGLPPRPRGRPERLKPMYRGGGRDYLVCGACCYAFAISVDGLSFQSRGILCPECGAVNDGP